ncbi:MAG: hypothetical protein WA950_15970, partial [Shinella sp.]|uniref:phage head spike fiber domain-containing protein n=1 Tax=Shinella sp. TaxID=1870904 RepID=UPI003C72F1A9
DRIGLEHANRWYVGRVTEASGIGTIRVISVEPPPPSNIAQAGAVVRFDRPGLLMRPVPDSYQATRSGRHYSVSFRLVEVAGVGSVPRDMDFNFTSPLVAAPYFTRASSATYFGADGLLKTAAINEPRIDHDPVTREPLGLLIEEPRTNLAVWSEAMDASAYTKVRLSVSADAAVSPTGEMTADRLIENTETGTHNVGCSVGITAGTAYVFSVFAKAAGRSRLLCTFSATGFSGNASLYYNLSTGIVENVVGAAIEDRGMIPCGNGWYRCWAKLTATATVNTYYEIRLADGTSSSYTGDGVSGLCLWGRQVEASAFPTTYIPTTTAAATRAAEGLSVPLDGWFNGLSGTFVVEAFASRPTSAYLTLDQVSPSYVNFLRLLLASTGQLIWHGETPSGQATGNIPLGSPSAGVKFKTAVAFDASDTRGAMNGALAGTRLGWWQSVVTQMKIGRGQNGYAPNAPVRRITYFPRRLSDAELQEITT